MRPQALGLKLIAWWFPGSYYFDEMESGVRR